jgi:hypothetical protein
VDSIIFRSSEKVHSQKCRTHCANLKQADSKIGILESLSSLSNYKVMFDSFIYDIAGKFRRQIKFVINRVFQVNTRDACIFQ